MSEGKIKRYTPIAEPDTSTGMILWDAEMHEEPNGDFVRYEPWIDDPAAFMEAHRALREAANQASIAITNLEFGGTSGFKFAKDIDDALLLCDAAEGEKP